MLWRPHRGGFEGARNPRLAPQTLVIAWRLLARHCASDADIIRALGDALLLPAFMNPVRLNQGPASPKTLVEQA